MLVLMEGASPWSTPVPFPVHLLCHTVLGDPRPTKVISSPPFPSSSLAVMPLCPRTCHAESSRSCLCVWWLFALISLVLGLDMLKTHLLSVQLSCALPVVIALSGGRLRGPGVGAQGIFSLLLVSPLCRPSYSG